jgi:hypothetical protein
MPKRNKKRIAVNALLDIKKLGRPLEYSADLIPVVKDFSDSGLSQEQMAQLLRIATQTLWDWMKKNPDFSDAVKGGKGISDDKVERSLYERALGYSHPEDQIFQFQGSPVIVPTVKHYPPDATSAIFWLKNRRPENWRERLELEIVGKLNELAVGMGNIVLSYVPVDKKEECAEKLKAILHV